MRRCNHFYNVPESKEDCEGTECQNCEHMRELLVEATECQECFDEKKKAQYINYVLDAHIQLKENEGIKQ